MSWIKVAICSLASLPQWHLRAWFQPYTSCGRLLERQKSKIYEYISVLANRRHGYKLKVQPQTAVSFLLAADNLSQMVRPLHCLGLHDPFIDLSYSQGYSLVFLPVDGRFRVGYGHRFTGRQTLVRNASFTMYQALSLWVGDWDAGQFASRDYVCGTLPMYRNWIIFYASE